MSIDEAHGALSVTSMYTGEVAKDVSGLTDVDYIHSVHVKLVTGEETMHTSKSTSI